MRLSAVKRRTHIKLFENNVRMSEKLQGFVLILPTIWGSLLVVVLKLRDFLLQIGIVGNVALVEKYHCAGGAQSASRRYRTELRRNGRCPTEGIDEKTKKADEA